MRRRIRQTCLVHAPAQSTPSCSTRRQAPQGWGHGCCQGLAGRRYGHGEWRAWRNRSRCSWRRSLRSGGSGGPRRRPASWTERFLPRRGANRLLRSGGSGCRHRSRRTLAQTLRQGGVDADRVYDGGRSHIILPCQEPTDVIVAHANIIHGLIVSKKFTQGSRHILVGS